MFNFILLGSVYLKDTYFTLIVSNFLGSVHNIAVYTYFKRKSDYGPSRKSYFTRIRAKNAKFSKHQALHWSSLDLNIHSRSCIYSQCVLPDIFVKNNFRIFLTLHFWIWHCFYPLFLSACLVIYISLKSSRKLPHDVKLVWAKCCAQHTQFLFHGLYHCMLNNVFQDMWWHKLTLKSTYMA